MRTHKIALSISVSLMSLFIAPQEAAAAPLTARSTTLYFFGGTDPLRESGTTRGGPWSLGQNRATVGLTPNIQPAGGPLTGTYAGGGDFVLAEKSEGDTKATARSEININAPKTADCPGALFCWALEVKATTEGGLFRFSKPADAQAKGNDPQFVASPGVFGQTVSLGAGSSIFESRPEVDEVDAQLILTAPDLAKPLAFIDLKAVDGHVDATVQFASDSRLRFFDLDTNSTITDSQVESLLEGLMTLGTADGLTSTVRLFSYEYDLSNTVLSADTSFGAEAINSAASPVPEPGPVALLGLGLAGLTMMRLRRVSTRVKAV